MTRTIKFEDSFWDEDFCGTVGFEILLRKLKDGRQMCKDWATFIKERAKIEEEYAIKLQKLTKSAGGNTEMGTLLHSWEEMKAKTENIASEHSAASKEMHKAFERINELMHVQKNKRTVEEQRITKSAGQKKELYKKVQENKKNFHSKSLEADALEKQISSVKSGGSVQMPSKEYEKLLTKYTRLKQEAERSDNTYKENLFNLDKCRLQWETDMTHMCNEFEALEVERIMFLRNEMWIHSNIISQTAVDDDEHCEEMREVLEKCDVDVDLTEFMETKKLGATKPGKIEYEGWGAATPSTPKRSLSDRPPQPLPNTKHMQHRMGAL